MLGILDPGLGNWRTIHCLSSSCEDYGDVAACRPPSRGHQPHFPRKWTGSSICARSFWTCPVVPDQAWDVCIPLLCPCPIGRCAQFLVQPSRTNLKLVCGRCEYFAFATRCTWHRFSVWLRSRDCGCTYTGWAHAVCTSLTFGVFVGGKKSVIWFWGVDEIGRLDVRLNVDVRLLAPHTGFKVVAARPE